MSESIIQIQHLYKTFGGGAAAVHALSRDDPLSPAAPLRQRLTTSGSVSVRKTLCSSRIFTGSPSRY